MSCSVAAASASSTTLHNMFNRKLTDMMEDLAACFPSVTEFAVALSPPARMLLCIDPCHGQHMFHQYVAVPFERHILSRDEKFMMSQEHFGPPDGPGHDVVAMIKRVWRAASTQDQDAIWKHLQVLLILNKRCIDSAS